MIAGVGIDVVEIDRMERIIARWSDRFLARIFTPREIAYCTAHVNAAHHFAARFAAKEAFAKAIATGWADVFHWCDVEVENELSGHPRLILHGRVADRFGDVTIHLSLTHTHATAAAVVVLERTAKTGG